MQEIIRVIRKVSREIVRELGLLEPDRTIKGISYAEAHALLEIKKYKVLTAGELSVILNLNRSSTARTIQKLKSKGWVSELPDPNDAKKKPVRLTEKGQEKLRKINAYSDRQVSQVLEFLSEDQIHSALSGMQVYVKALKLSRVADHYTIRLIRKSDNPAIKDIIRTVSREFSTCGESGSIRDEELYDMYSVYSKPKAAYYIVGEGKKVLGGAGIGPLASREKGICEFRKMYFLSRARGRGLGEILMRKCIQKAADFRYKKVYIETMNHIPQSVQLYRKLGARTITSPLGDTDHHKSETRLVIDLPPPSYETETRTSVF